MISSLFKRNLIIFSTLISGILIFSLSLIFINFKGYIKADTYDSANGSFIISTAADMKKFASEATAGNYNCFEGIEVKLGDNIDMGGTWTFIASNSTYPFKGTFNGDNYTILNIGETIYTYSFADGITTVRFIKLPAQNNVLEIFEKPYTVNVEYDSNQVNYTYYATGANLMIDAQVKAGYYIDNVRINNGEIIVIDTSYGFYKYANNLGLSWVVRDDNSVIFTFIDATEIVNFTINSALGQIDVSEPSSIDKIAVISSIGGEARVLQKDENTFTIIAVSYSGYKFVGWTVDDGKSYLLNDSGERLGLSTNISLDKYKGKLIKAVFTLIDNKLVNDETDNTQK